MFYFLERNVDQTENFNQPNNSYPDCELFM